MSELKTYNSVRIYWAVEQSEQEAGDIEGLHLDDNLFYLKSDADNVISKLESSVAIEQNLNKLAIDALRHQKYERCLNKANYWLVISYHCIDGKHKQRAERRRYKWLELSKKFKEEGE